MNFEFHCHSRYSYDSIASPERILQAAKKKGLDGIAITDHDTIKGVREARSINDDPDFFVISGIEVRTDIGDLIGLFINDEIKSRDCRSVINEIHEQGGLVVLPHPYKGHKNFDFIIGDVDLIEVFNGRAGTEANGRAKELADKYCKPMIVGSDAHFLSEIGRCRVVLPGHNIREELLAGSTEFTIMHAFPYMESASQLIKFINRGNYSKIPGQILSVIKKYCMYHLGTDIRADH